MTKLSGTAKPFNATVGASGDRLTVYFDGSCALCAAEIDFYASRTGSDALQLVDVSEPGAETGPGLDRSLAISRFHVRRPDGSLASGAAAFVAIWETLPGWRLGANLAGFRPVTILLEAGYRLFLPVRPILSRLVRRWSP